MLEYTYIDTNVRTYLYRYESAVVARFMTLADLFGGIGSNSRIRKVLLRKYGGRNRIRFC